MKYRVTKIKTNDAIITDPNDELYDLQAKYNVKISRSNKSDAVYIFKTASKKMRIGHYIPLTQSHIYNFQRNVIQKKVTKDVVEKAIIKYYHEL